MERQFSLVLTNWRKAAVIQVGGMLLLFALLILFAIAVSRLPLLVLLTGCGVLMAAIIFLPERIAKRFSKETATVVIDETGLTIHDETANKVRRLLFVDIASYSNEYYADLTIRPQHGPALKLYVNWKLHPEGSEPMRELGQHFQWAVADYLQQHPDQPPIRNLGFFNRPAATFWLAIFTAFMIWLGWRAWQPFASEGVWGGFILAGLLFVIYVLTWHHHRKHLPG